MSRQAKSRTAHKTVGRAYFAGTLLFLALGGALAMLMRWQLADPKLLKPETYNILFTLHATVMIYYAIIPVQTSAFGNYLIPLKIGASDMAMPRLGGASFWLWLLGGVVLLFGTTLAGGGAATGWTAYAPLSNIQFNGNGSRAFAAGWPIAAVGVCAIIAAFAGWTMARLAGAIVLGLAGCCISRLAFDGQSCWIVSLLLFGISSLMGAINTIVTIALRRCRGMTMMRLPLSVWSLLITAFIILLATPVLGAALTMSLLDHHRITHFFEPANWIDNGKLDADGNGMALLWPQLFWFYGHPAVYVMILPAMGIVSDILPVFSRKPLFGYFPMLLAMIAIAVLGFVVWGHHLFQSGLNPTIGNAFALSSMVIAVPSAVETFSWIATIWGGSIELTAAMLSAMGFVSLFVIGGMSGIFLASTAVDAQLHNTYFVVAHIHYVLFGGSLFGIFGGIYFWLPKIVGRRLNETAGRWHVVLTYLLFNATFLPMHYLGLMGMPRRISDSTGYDSFRSLQPLNVAITHSAFGLGLVQIIFAANVIWSLRFGKSAGDNPWRATTLEWQTTSPPPAGNFETAPIVFHEPYEYSSLDGRDRFIPQNQPVGNFVAGPI